MNLLDKTEGEEISPVVIALIEAFNALPEDVKEKARAEMIKKHQELAQQHMNDIGDFLTKK